jgi:ABC-type Fe3+-siderophore transport system permease subunit
LAPIQKTVKNRLIGEVLGFIQPRPSLLVGLILSLLILLICLVVSIGYGAADISASTIYAALTAFDGSADHLIIRTIRIPRSLIAILVGAAMAIAGGVILIKTGCSSGHKKMSGWSR